MHSLTGAKAPRVVVPPRSEETGIPDIPYSCVDCEIFPDLGRSSRRFNPPEAVQFAKTPENSKAQGFLLPQTNASRRA